MARLSLIDSRSPTSVRSARLVHFGTKVSCVASDAGATMTVVRKRSGRNRLTFLGVTISRAGKRGFSLPASLPKDRGLDLELGAVSPSGREVTTAFGPDASSRAMVIQTTSDRHSRLFRVPRVINHGVREYSPSVNAFGPSRIFGIRSRRR